METILPTLFHFFLDVVLKATLVLSLAGLLLTALRRRSASTRHLVGTFGLAGALLVPLLSTVAPPLEVPLLPSPVLTVEVAATGGAQRERALDGQALRPWRSETLETSARGTAKTERVPNAGGDSHPLTPAGRSLREARPPAAAGASLGEGRPLALPRSQGEREEDATVSAGTAKPVEDRLRQLALPGMAIVLIAWIAGAILLLARLAVGIGRVAWCRRRAAAVGSPAWLALTRSLARSLGIQNRVSLYWSDRVPVAVTSGLRRPSLLLPESAAGWDFARRRVVLLHELAHVARRDWLALVLSEIALAVYWFHPLAWLLARRLRRDGEKAADDRVLSAGTKPSVYAGHLLGIIRSLRPAPKLPVLVMGVARPSHFEERLRAILDPSLRRRGPSAGQARMAAAALFALAATIAAVEPWAPRSAEAAITSVAADTHPFGLGLPPAKSESQCAEKTRSGKAMDEEKPLLLADGFTMDPSESGEGGAPGGVWSAASEGTETEADAVEKAQPAPGESGGGVQHAVESGAPEGAGASVPGLVKASNDRSKEGHDWFGRGMKLHRKGRYDEAIEAFRSAYQADYRRDTSAYNIACGYALKGDSDRAFEWLEKAAEEGFDVSSYLDHDEDLESLQSDSRTRELRKKLRELQVASRGREAERLAERFHRLAKEDPRDGNRWYQLGKELLEVGRYDLAGKAFRLSAKAGNRVGASLYNTACALSLEGDRTGALDYLERSLLAGFDDPSLLRKDGDLDAIREEPRYRELVQLADGLELRSADESGEKKHDGGEDLHRASWAWAARGYETFAKRHPKIGRAWFNLGFASLSGGDAGGAIRAFQTALSLGYREPTTMYNLACSYSRLDRKDEAFGWLFKALDAGFEEEWTMRHDDDLEALRGDSRYRQALKIVRGNSRHED